MWCFGAPVIITLLWYTSLCASQTLELCDAPIKDDVCVLQCLTSDLSQSVVFKKDNTEYASCKYILGTLSCTSIYPIRSLISQQSSPSAITFLNITQLSRAGDQGSWTCDFGSSGSTAQTLTVLTAPTQLSSFYEVNHDFCINSTSFDVTLTVTCSTQTDAKVELTSHTTGNVHTETPTTSKGAACSDVAENIYTADHTITSGTGGITAGNYTVTLKAQLPGGIGEEYSVFAGYVFFGPCDPTPCTCIMTIILGSILGLIFTPLLIIVIWVVLVNCVKIDVVKNCIGVNVKCITMVVICAVISSGLVVGFTFLVVSRHDKGNEETGCSCIVYVGILLALLFSVVMTAVYFFVCWKTKNDTVKPNDQEKNRREESDGNKEKITKENTLRSEPKITPVELTRVDCTSATTTSELIVTVDSRFREEPYETCSTLCEVCLDKSEDCSFIPQNPAKAEVCSAFCEVCMNKFKNSRKGEKKRKKEKDRVQENTPRELPPIINGTINEKTPPRRLPMPPIKQQDRMETSNIDNRENLR